MNDNESKMIGGLQIKDAGPQCVKDFGCLTMPMADDFFARFPDQRLVLHASQSRENDVDHIRQVLGTKYYTSLGHVAKRNQVQIPGISDRQQTSVNQVSLSPFDSRDTAVQFMMKTFEETFLDRWSDYMGPVKNTMRLQMGHICKTVPFDMMAACWVDDEVVGVMLTMPHKNCTGEPLILCAWVWIHSDLEHSLRRQVRHELVRWMLERHEGVELFKAMVNPYNIASQRFFTDVGFGLQCAHIFNRG